MKKALIILGALAAICSLQVLTVQAAPTSTYVQNLLITGLAGNGTECLHILNSGLVQTTSGDCGSGSGGNGSSTVVVGVNGVTVTGLVGNTQTSSLDTTFAASWSALETFLKGILVKGSTTLASSTSCGILTTNASGTIICGSTPVLSVASSATISASASTGAGISFSLLQSYLTAGLTSINGNSTTAQTFTGGTGISVSSAGGNTTTTNTGVTSFSGQGCVTAANSTGTVALTVTCISGNQTITFTIGGDATGTGSGTTAISDNITVTGLNGKPLPALATGTLQYSGGAWKINLAANALGLYDSSGNLSSYIGSSCGGGQFVTGFSATGTVACASPPGAETVYQSSTLFMIGDSITEEVAGGLPVSKDWFKYLTIPRYHNDSWQVVADGTGGRDCSDMYSHRASEIDPDYIASSSMNVLIIQCQGNDLAHGQTVSQFENTIQSFGQAEQAVGWNVIVTPMFDSTSSHATASQIAQYNTFLAANWPNFANAEADYNQDPRLYGAGASNNLTYFYTDNVHLTDAGLQVFASYEQKAIDQVENSIALGLVSGSSTFVGTTTFPNLTPNNFAYIGPAGNLTTTSSPTTGAAGASSDVQFNLKGAFAATSSLTFLATSTAPSSTPLFAIGVTGNTSTTLGTPSTTSFSYTGAVASWTVPGTNTSTYALTISMAGATGGSNWSGPTTGGFGGLATGTLNLPGATVLYYGVGQQGVSITSSTVTSTSLAGGWPGGGPGTHGGIGAPYSGASGAGYTWIGLNVTSTATSSDLMIAPGGGGSGCYNGNGGNAGGLTGDDGGPGSGTNTGGMGATQTSGGNAGSVGNAGGNLGTAGSAFQGGTGGATTSTGCGGAGGGGGLFGGGSSASVKTTFNAAGAAAGSPFASSSITSFTTATGTGAGNGSITITFAQVIPATSTVTWDGKSWLYVGGGIQQQSVTSSFVYANASGTLVATGTPSGSGLASSSPFTVGNLTIATSGSALSTYGGSNCGGGQYATGLSASGTVACGSPSGAGTVTQVYGGTGISVSPNPITATGTVTNTGVTSFTGQNCVTSSNSTGTITLTVSCISANQNITFTINGDATGTASGATSITDTVTVTGLNGKALPANTTGTLYYSGSAWNLNTLPTSVGGTGITGSPSNGSILIGSSTVWTIGNLTPSGCVTVTNATGTITIGSTCLTAAITTFNGSTSSTQNFAVVSGNNLATTSIASTGGNSTTTLTVNPTLASSTRGSFSIATNTGNALPFLLLFPNQATFQKITCADQSAGTSTFAFGIYGGIASTTTNSLIATTTGGVAGTSVTAFVSSTISAGQFFGVTSTVAGTPTVTSCSVISTIQ